MVGQMGENEVVAKWRRYFEETPQTLDVTIIRDLKTIVEYATDLERNRIPVEAVPQEPDWWTRLGRFLRFTA